MFRDRKSKVVRRSGAVTSSNLERFQHEPQPSAIGVAAGGAREEAIDRAIVSVNGSRLQAGGKVQSKKPASSSLRYFMAAWASIS
ncbi:hypothetical protein ACWGS9_33865, partial [Bradyrhizobium sp. Arg314]